MPEASALLSAVGQREVLLCTGPGGVGKTTSSAALAVHAASAGKKVAVLTIDPARRLADALGVELDNVPKRVTLPASLQAEGELWALMLDPVRTFDELVNRLAPTPSVAERLLSNIIYRQMSRALAGTLEYTAVEKLFDLRERFDFDLIVVDTPPSKNVIDFVEAPQWLLRFLDERVFKWFLMLEGKDSGHGLTAGILRRTARVVRDVLGKIFGEAFLGDLGEFMGAIEGMTAEFRRRAGEIQELLRSPASGFLVVATTDRFVLEDASFLFREISARGVHFDGFIVNRVVRPSGVEYPDDVANRIRAAAPEEPSIASVAAKLIEETRAIDEHAASDADAIASLRARTGWQGFVGTLPREPEEIHELDALSRLAKNLEQA